MNKLIAATGISIERLSSIPDEDAFGNIYGTIPPSNTKISSTVNELIDEISIKSSIIDSLLQRIEKLEKPRYESGYLRSKFGV